MIFPDPFEDEIFYSVIARMADRMGLDNIQAISRHVFGCKAVMPSGLGVPPIHLMVPRLLPGSPHSGYSLIARHSLVPYYTAFSGRHSTESIAEKLMAGDRSATIGLNGMIPSPLGLRFCERCAAESLDQAREPFWARSHQLPGVSVCYRHLCSLSEGSTSRSDARPTYLSLSRIIRETHPTREIAVRAPSNIVEKVAIVSHDLLAADLSSRTTEAATSFFGLLSQRGWRHHDRPDALSHARLNARVLECFGSDIIKDLGIELSFYSSAGKRTVGTSTGWIFDTMFKKGRVGVPLPYVLVLIAVGSSVAELTAARVAVPITETKVEKVEVCGNPLCQFYDHTFMKSGQVRPDMAAFDASCSKCGFVARWSRRGSGTARREILHFGKLWDDTLVQECQLGMMPMYRMMERFGTTAATIRKRALQLDVWHPRWHAGHRDEATQAIEATVEARRAVALDDARATWLQAQARFPDAGRKELSKGEPWAHHVLRRWDPEWLDRTTPKLRGRAGRKPNPPAADDPALAQRIIQAASEIKAREPQTRVVRRLVFRALGRSNIHLSKSGYPESTEALRAIAAAGSRRNRRGET